MAGLTNNLINWFLCWALFESTGYCSKPREKEFKGADASAISKLKISRTKDIYLTPIGTHHLRLSGGLLGIQGTLNGSILKKLYYPKGQNIALKQAIVAVPKKKKQKKKKKSELLHVVMPAPLKTLAPQTGFYLYIVDKKVAFC